MLQVFTWRKPNHLDWLLLLKKENNWSIRERLNHTIWNYYHLKRCLMPENPCFNWYVVWNVINCLSIPNFDLWKSYWQEDARKTARECTANNCCMDVVHCSWNKMPEFRTGFDNPWKYLPRHLAPDTIKKRLWRVLGFDTLREK